MAYDPTIELLIIDDDLHVLAVLEDVFSTEKDLAVTAMSDSVEAIDLIHRRRFDLIITDLVMPRADGLAVTRAAQESQPGVLVMIITGYASLETTLEAIHLGVYDYITKPFQIDEFRLLISNASTRIRLERENAELRDQVDSLQQKLQTVEIPGEPAAGGSRDGVPDRRRDGTGEHPAAPAPRPAIVDVNKISVYERMAAGRGTGRP